MDSPPILFRRGAEKRRCGGFPHSQVSDTEPLALSTKGAVVRVVEERAGLSLIEYRHPGQQPVKRRLNIPPPYRIRGNGSPSASSEFLDDGKIVIVLWLEDRSTSTTAVPLLGDDAPKSRSGWFLCTVSLRDGLVRPRYRLEGLASGGDLPTAMFNEIAVRNSHLVWLTWNRRLYACGV
jgi:hypothetical protein